MGTPDIRKLANAFIPAAMPAVVLPAAALSAIYRFTRTHGVPTRLKRPSWSAAAWIAAAVFSHWVLDWVVHRPDLPLYDDALKVGPGVWDYPFIALSLEAVLLFGGMFMYLRRTRPLNPGASGRMKLVKIEPA